MVRWFIPKLGRRLCNREVVCRYCALDCVHHAAHASSSAVWSTIETAIPRMLKYNSRLSDIETWHDCHLLRVESQT